MSYYFKNIKPGYDSESEGDDLEELLKRNVKTNRSIEDNESDDDELRALSFGSLKKADAILSEEDEEEEEVTRRRNTSQQKNFKTRSFKDNDNESNSNSNSVSHLGPGSDSGSDSDSDSEQTGFFEEDEVDRKRSNYNKQEEKKKGKHAPTEQSSKRRVSKRREISGLNVPKNLNSNLYQDIRFDKSLGEGQPTDNTAARRHYQFLDEYRQKEIHELEKLVKDRKFLSKISNYEREEMDEQLKSMKSKLQTVKNRDLERQIIKDYEKEINKDNVGKFHLKKNDKRKVIQKWKFDHMKAKQREKVMERKRKKRLGKEFKQFEFHKSR